MTIPTPSPRSIIASSATLSSLCIVAVSMRFWARSLQRAKLSVDDWLMLPALVSHLPPTLVERSLTSSHGLAYDNWNWSYLNCW